MAQPAETKPAPEPAPATGGCGDGADDTNHAEQMYKDLRVKDLSFFTGTWGDQAKWPRLLVFCASDIPLTHDEYKKVAVMRKDGGASIMKSIKVNLVVVDAISEGFTKVPLFKEGNTFKNAEGAKPMSRLVESERLPGSGLRDVQCWPWTMIRENPQAKGAIREEPELGWRLQPGMVIRLSVWEDSMRGYPSKDKRPMSKELAVSGADGMDVIPAFSMLNVEVAIKAWCPRVKGEEYVDAVSGQKKTREEKDLSPVMKQYGIGVTEIRALGGTMYSCAGKVRQALMPTHIHGEALQKEQIEANWCIARCLESMQAPMYVQDVSPDTFFLSDPENEIIKLTSWSSGLDEMPIDIRFSDVMRFTNCASIEEGVSLMEFACQAGCLEVACFHDKYRKRRGDEDPIYSELYGVPIIDVPKLLACVRPPQAAPGASPDGAPVVPPRTHAGDPRFFEFDADYKVMSFTDDGIPDRTYRPKVLVSKTPVARPDVKPPAAGPAPAHIGSPDMCLVGSGYPMERAYVVRFINTVTGGVACSAFFNLSTKPSGLMTKSSCGNVLAGGAGSRLVRKRWASGQLTRDPETITDPFGDAMAAPQGARAAEPKKAPKASASSSPSGKAGAEENDGEEEGEIAGENGGEAEAEVEEEEEEEEQDEEEDEEEEEEPTKAKGRGGAARAASVPAAPRGGGGGGSRRGGK